MTKLRSVTLWALLVSATGIATLGLHIDARSQQVDAAPQHHAKPITMGIRN